MANMSYCRFENTLGDLRDCHRAMYEPTAKMNEYERVARLQLSTLVQEMATEIEAMAAAGTTYHGDAEKHEDQQYL